MLRGDIGVLQFTLLGSRFSVRVQVRFAVRGSRFGVRGSGSGSVDHVESAHGRQGISEIVFKNSDRAISGKRSRNRWSIRLENSSSARSPSVRYGIPPARAKY